MGVDVVDASGAAEVAGAAVPAGAVVVCAIAGAAKRSVVAIAATLPSAKVRYFIVSFLPDMVVRSALSRRLSAVVKETLTCEARSAGT